MSVFDRKRSPRKLRRQIAGTLLITAFTAVALFGALNYFAAARLLNEGTRDQLASVAEGRARTIESGMDRLTGEVSAIASDLGVARALTDFVEAFDELQSTELDAAQLAELEAFYENSVIAPLEAAGLGTYQLDDVLPDSNAARYIQYNYSLRDPGEIDTPPPVDPGDGSTYTEFNVAYQDFMRTISEGTGGGDLLLISAETGEVVYSFDKRVDVGTSLIDGSFSESALAQAVIDRLPQVQSGETVVTNFDIYIPGGGKPVLFASSAIRSGTEVVGALAIQVPIEALNAITTANGQWEEVGLGDGESYVVASDLTLQSESRLWIEDPEKYLDDVGSDELRALIAAFGSPVGLQQVDTEPVRQALNGEPFVGGAKNYLGQKTFSSSASIDVPGVKWVVVTDTPSSTAKQPLNDYLRNMLYVLLVVLPSSALIGMWLARRLTRPIRPAVEAATAVANGERNPDLPPLGRDEFGDLGRRLKRMAGELERQEQALADEYEDTRQLMLAVLPAHLVQQDGELNDTGATSDTATVVAVSVDTAHDDLDSDDEDLIRSLATISGFAEELAEERGIERIRVAADRYLFLAGSGASGDGSDSALEFAKALMFRVDEFEQTADFEFIIHIGLSTGPVATGVLQSGNLTFGAWGEPVRRALAISALSENEEILVDTSTAVSASDSWTMGSAEHIVDLNDEPMRLFTLQLDAADALS